VKNRQTDIVVRFKTYMVGDNRVVSLNVSVLKVS